MWIAIFVGVLILLALAVAATIVHSKSYYTWSPALVSDPLSSRKIDPKPPSRLTVPRGYDEGFGAADPFLVDGYIFAEIMKEGKGIIAVAESWGESLDFIPVLEEEFHLSYPSVFRHEGTWYMIPEAYQSGSILLYRTDDFPHGWERVKPLADIDGCDSTVFNLGGRWYMFTTSVRSKDNMILTTDNFPVGPWYTVVLNPLPREYRGGGQALYHNGDVLLPLQPPTTILHGYGWKLEVYKVNRDLSMEKVTTINPPTWAGGVHHLSYDPTSNQYMIDVRRHLKRQHASK